MLFPTRSNLFEDFFQDDFFTQKVNHMMSTDIREEDQGYIIDMNIPGFSKEELSMNLERGYLTVTANHQSNDEKKNESGKIISRERYTGTMSRSFYVGDSITPDDIQANFIDGVLTIQLAKKNMTNSQKYIEIL